MEVAVAKFDYNIPKKIIFDYDEDWITHIAPQWQLHKTFNGLLKNMVNPKDW